MIGLNIQLCWQGELIVRFGFILMAVDVLDLWPFVLGKSSQGGPDLDQGVPIRGNGGPRVDVFQVGFKIRFLDNADVVAHHADVGNEVIVDPHVMHES